MKTRILAAVAAVSMVAGCAPPPADYAAELKPALDDFVEAWNTGDMDKLDAALTDDYRRTTPFGVEAESLDAMKGVMTAFRTAYPDANVTLTETHFTESRAFINWTFTGTNTGPGDMPPTGRPVNIDGYTVVTFDGGKAASEEVYFDTLAWMTQLGATLIPPGATDAKQAAVGMFVEAWNTGDMSKLDGSVTDNFRRTTPAGIEAESREALKAVMATHRLAYPDTKVEITDSRYAGDRAFLNWTFTGTNTGPGDTPPTDKAVQVSGYTIMHFDGDQIAREEVYFDMLAWMTQIGATLMPPGG